MTQSDKRQKGGLLRLLIVFTLLLVLAQSVFFLIHYNALLLMDALIKSSILPMMGMPVVLLPIFMFLLIHLLAYALVISWVYFFVLSLKKSYLLCLGIWLLAFVFIFTLNQYYFPHSFFAFFNKELNSILLIGSALLLIMIAVFSYARCFCLKQYRLFGAILFILTAGIMMVENPSLPQHAAKLASKANIIIIGLDSVRPDYIHYLGNQAIHTPHIDRFLQSAAVFTNAYTPLARTFPAWMSILTGKYPKHHHARNNLPYPAPILFNETLAKRLQQAGYETIYASDEKRFSNITKQYGFDHLIGPSMGVNDFLLAGMTDFPLTNLLIHLPIGRFLFPYHYGNRAANITYDPDSFLQLLKAGLQKRSDKPLFLAVHLCLAHWPYTFADDKTDEAVKLSDHYRVSVEAVDQQLGQLLQILRTDGLLANSVVVLLSDHGTTLGLPHDRIVTEENYRGNSQKIHWLQVNKLNTALAFSVDFEHDYTINTSYGQGTDVLSLKQYRVLLAMQGIGLPQGVQNKLVTLMDVAPSLLDYLHLTPLTDIDGLSMLRPIKARPFFMETADSLSEIETDHIYLEKVVAGKIGIYEANPLNGLLYIDPIAEAGINKNKQRSVLLNQWLFARFPASPRTQWVAFSAEEKAQFVLAHSTLPAYFILVNLADGIFTMDLSSEWAKRAPLAKLMQEWQAFYGDEV